MAYEQLKYNVYFISLYNDLKYSTNVDINNLSCTFNFSYNSRLNQRVLNITTSDGTVLLKNTAISLTTPILFSNYFELLGNLDSVIYFRKKDITVPLDILKWADNIEIFLITLPPSEADQYFENEKYMKFAEKLNNS